MERFDKYLREYFGTKIDNNRYKKWLSSQKNTNQIADALAKYDLLESEEQTLVNNITKDKSVNYYQQLRDSYANRDYNQINRHIKNRISHRVKLHDYDTVDFNYDGMCIYKPKSWGKVHIMDMTKSQNPSLMTLNTGDMVLVMQNNSKSIKLDDSNLDPAQRYLLQFNKAGKHQLNGNNITVVGPDAGPEDNYRFVENPIVHSSVKPNGTTPSIIKPKLGDDVAIPKDYVYCNSDFSVAKSPVEGLHYIRQQDNDNIYVISKPKKYYFKNNQEQKITVDSLAEKHYNWNSESFGIVEQKRQVTVPCYLNFSSSDNQPHDIYLADEQWRPSVKISEPKSRFDMQYYLSEPGTYRFVCSSCKNMRMQITAKRPDYVVKLEPGADQEHTVTANQRVIFKAGGDKEASLCGRDSIIVPKCKGLNHKTEFDKPGNYEFRDPINNSQYHINVVQTDPIDIHHLLAALPGDLELEYRPEYLDHIRKCHLKSHAKRLCKRHLNTVPKSFDKLSELDHYKMQMVGENDNFMHFYAGCPRLQQSITGLLLEKLKRQKHPEIDNLYSRYQSDPKSVSEQIYQIIDKNGELDLSKLSKI